MSVDGVARIRARLESTFSPLDLDIRDDSAKHAGHAGAGEGGHYAVHIVASAFAGQGRLERHRLVYNALGDLMRKEIHALSISAHAPDEPH